ncbi:ribonuclease H-like domain-containing protein [Cladochytrium replicatum]|nr:ribonuclease H-like domain-containing protein [Cladochytrium replicatum]
MASEFDPDDHDDSLLRLSLPNLSLLSLDDSPSSTNSTAVSSMTVDQLRSRLAALNLPVDGKKEKLKSRLRSALKSQRLALERARMAEEELSEDDDDDDAADGSQPYAYYCVMDFEATCERDAQDYPNEIIEFPVVLVDGATHEVAAEFHQYVRPVINPTLTDFCKELTGITQLQVDSAQTFPDVLKDLESWLSKHDTPPFRNIVFVTDGPWDLRDFFRKQLSHSNANRPPSDPPLQRPEYLSRFVDLRKLVAVTYGAKRRKITDTLSWMGMEFEGREHSGIDDARNIARILMWIMKDGVAVRDNALIVKRRKGGRHGRSRGDRSEGENDGEDEWSIEYF